MKIYQRNKKSVDSIKTFCVLGIAIISSIFIFDFNVGEDLSFALCIFLPAIVYIYFTIGKYKFVKDENNFKVYFGKKLKKEFNLEETEIKYRIFNNVEMIDLKSKDYEHSFASGIIGKELFDELKSELFSFVKPTTGVIFNSEIKQNGLVLRLIVSIYRIMVTIISITMLILVVIALYEKDYYFALGFVIILFVNLLQFFVVTKIIKFKENKKILAYVEKNDDLGLLHIPYNNFGIHNIKFSIIDGITANETIIETNKSMFYKTYFLKSGTYKIHVKYTTDTFFVTGYTSKEEFGEILDFKVEPRNYYVLSFNKTEKKYEFKEQEVPRKFYDILHN